MSTPLYKPRLIWSGALWRCKSTGPRRSNSGWSGTPAGAYADWIKKLHLDGIYWEFFA